MAAPMLDDELWELFQPLRPRKTRRYRHPGRRLRLRYERRADIHEAFLSLACSLICLRQLRSSFW